MAIGSVKLPLSAGTGPPPSPQNGAYPFNGSVNSISDVAIIGELLDSLPFIGEVSSIHKIATGLSHLVAIKNFVVGTGGELWVFGINTNGAIGGATEYVWERIGSDSDWTDIAAAGTSSYAIRAGRLYVTGQNNAGQLGNGSTTNVATFTQIGTDTNWTFVSAGETWAAAVKGGNLLTCGSNANFRTGLNTNSGNQTTWTVANNTQTWLNTSCGRNHGAGVTTDGKLFSWGLNSLGRTGQGTTAGSTQIPTQIGSDTNWILSSTCNANIYALKSTGTLWGAGFAGGSIWGNSTPTSMTQESLGDTNWDWVASTGASGIYARKTTGTLWSSGAFPGNLISTTALFQLNQVGTDTNWKKEFVGNTNGNQAQITFIKS
jgi:alpha-tubulin suppressor-like RCC1 family protein